MNKKYSIFVVLFSLGLAVLILLIHRWNVPNALSDLILALTGLVIVIYTYETYRLRAETVEGNIATNRPILSVVCFLSDGSMTGEGLGGIELKNSGKGPAINIRISVSGNGKMKKLMSGYDPGVIGCYETRRVGTIPSIFSEIVTKNKSNKPVVITIKYSDIVNCEYKTEVYLAGEVKTRPDTGDIEKIVICPREKR